MTNDKIRTIQSADIVFDIFEFIKDRNGATLTEIAEAVDKAPSTVHQYLTTLEQREFVVRSGDEYEISHCFLDFGIYARQQNPMFDLAKEKVAQIVEETGERAQFSVAEHSRIVVLYTEAGEQAVRAGVCAGQRLPIHANAAGKAILVFSAREYVDDAIERHGLKQVTEHTITDTETLRAELESIRRDGVAYNDREDTRGLRAIGVPVLDPDNRPLGALSVSGPVQRLEEPEQDKRIRSLLRGSANELELRVEYR